MNRFRLNTIVTLVYPWEEKYDWNKIYDPKPQKPEILDINLNEKNTEYYVIRKTKGRLKYDELTMKEEGEGGLRIIEALEKKQQEILKRNKKSEVVQRLVPLLAVFTNYLDPEPLVDQIAYEFEKTKFHSPIKYQITDALKSLLMQRGLKYTIGIIGKFNGSRRRRKLFINRRAVCVQEFTKRVNYAQTEARARTGSFGIKMWVSY